MGKVLTEASSVQCGHAAGLSMTGSGRLRVSGDPVLTTRSVLNGAIDTPSCANTGTGTKKCTKVVSLSSGSAVRLKVDGQAVVIDSLHGATDGNPIGPLAVINAADDKLRAA